MITSRDVAGFFSRVFIFVYRVDNLYISNFSMNTEHPNLTPLTNCLKCSTPLSTYKATSFDKDEILANHRSFMTSLSNPSGKESEDLPYLYWIPKLHKTPYKERYIAGSSTCSTKELSIQLTKILSAVKEGQQKYCETVYSRSGINHMWILKNSKDLLDNLKSRSFSQVSSVKTWFFNSIYHPTTWQIKNPLKRNNS